MMVVKKIQEKLFEAVVSGKKKAEFRLNDFEINEGDILRLVEVDSNNNETGRVVEKITTNVWKCDIKDTFWPVEEILEKGVQVVSFE